MEIIDNNDVLDSNIYASRLVNAVPLLLSYCDANLVYRFINDNYQSWFNKTADDIIGKRVPDILGDRVYQHVAPRIERVLEGHVEAFEADLTYKDGTQRHVHVTYTPDIDTQGQVKGIFVSVGDITNYHQSEENLKDLQIRHDLALRGLSVGIWDWNVQTNELAWSYRFKEIVGVSESSFRPHFNEFADRLHSEDREATLAAVHNHLKHKVPYDVEYRLKHNAGHYVWIRAQGQALWDEHGKPIRMVGSVDDISKRKVAEKKLRERETYLDAIIENIPSMIFIKEANALNFTQFNKAGEKLLGISREKMIGKNDYDFFPKEQADFFTKADRDVLKNGKLKIIEEEEIDTAYGKKILRTKKVPIALDDNRHFLLGISEDITETRKAEQEIKRVIEELSKSNTALERFAHVVSHDLREPLRGISSCTQLLEQRMSGKLDDKSKEFMGAIQDGVSRMAELIDSLLVYSKLSAHSLPFSKQNCNDILSFATSNLAQAIEESQASVSSDPLPTVSGDRAQLVQLFQNLLSNAIKYHSDRPIQIHIRAERRKYDWVLSFKDNGIGIQKDYIEDIFTIFKRLENRSKYPGTGIGLAICRKVLENHRGEIWAESTAGQGATFYFTLPADST